jgi:hypothetical protein
MESEIPFRLIVKIIAARTMQICEYLDCFILRSYLALQAELFPIRGAMNNWPRPLSSHLTGPTVLNIVNF